MARWTKANIVNGVRTPQRMFPRHGGDPLPFPPIVAPGHTYPAPERAAAEYVKLLDKELATGEDGGEPKWDAGQRQTIRRERAKWLVRAHGEDAHYKKHGTFPRPMNAERPTWGDVRTELSRQKARAEGTYVSNAEHHRQAHMTRSDRIAEMCRDLKRKYHSKNPKPPDD